MLKKKREGGGAANQLKVDSIKRSNIIWHDGKYYKPKQEKLTLDNMWWK